MNDALQLINKRLEAARHNYDEAFRRATMLEGVIAALEELRHALTDEPDTPIVETEDGPALDLDSLG